MKVNPYNQSEGQQPNKKSRVVIGPLKKESVMLDRNGNQIDRRTRQIVKLNEQ